MGITEPIKASSTTTCLEVVSALEALPNTVIPSGSVFCSDYIGQYDEMLGSYAYEATVEGGFHMYSLTFTGNPGYLKPIEIDSTLDGRVVGRHVGRVHRLLRDAVRARVRHDHADGP